VQEVQVEIELFAVAMALGRRDARLGGLVQRYFDMWNTGDGRVADLVLDTTYVDHAHPEVIGPAAVRSLVPRFHASDPEARMRIEIVAADADFVAVRNTVSRARDGQRTESEGIALFRVVAGKLTEQWSWYPEAESAGSPPSARPSIDAWLAFRA